MIEAKVMILAPSLPDVLKVLSDNAVSILDPADLKATSGEDVYIVEIRKAT